MSLSVLHKDQVYSYRVQELTTMGSEDAKILFALSTLEDSFQLLQIRKS